MGGPVSSITAEIYMQAYERTAITTILHPLKGWEPILVTFILSLNVGVWKAFSIISTIFIKILSLLWKNKVMES